MREITIMTKLIALLHFALVYSKPVIGIFGLPNPQSKTDVYLNATIGETYVRFLESLGANTVAIHPWLSEPELDDILSKVNGVVFQGGGVPLGTTTQYDKNVKYILTKAKQFFDAGEHFPVLGICLGFESILIVEANDKAVLGYFSDSGRAHPSILTEKTKSSRMHSLFQEKDFTVLEAQDSTHHFHVRGVGEGAFNNNAYLKENYVLTLLASDKEGKVFISAFEGVKYPIYGLQFHPEKTPFNKEANYPLDHNSFTIGVSQLYGFSFIKEARSNKHSFDYSTDIDKYDFIYTYKRGSEVMHGNFNYYYAKK